MNPLKKTSHAQLDDVKLIKKSCSLVRAASMCSTMMNFKFMSFTCAEYLITKPFFNISLTNFVLARVSAVSEIIFENKFF